MKLSKSFFYILSLAFLTSAIQAQTYQLEWIDSLERNLTGYSYYHPIIVMDQNSESIYIAAHKKKGQTDIILTKYSFTGEKIWESVINFLDLDLLIDLKLDNKGNIYIQQNGWALLKYSPAGNLLWRHTYPLGEFTTMAQTFMITDTDEIFIIGSKYNLNDTPNIQVTAVLLKISDVGDILWAKDLNFNVGWKMNAYNNELNILGSIDTNYCMFNCTFNGDSLYFHEFALDEFIRRQSTSDKYGNFYSGAWFEDYQATKVNRSGNIEWHYNFTPKIGERPLRSHQVHPDNNGNTYIAGDIISDSSAIDILVTKLDEFGKLIWEIRYNNKGDSLAEAVQNLYVTDDYIFVLGVVEEQFGIKESLILRISKDGDEVIEIRPNSNINYHTTCFSMSEDSNKNIYVIGSGLRDDSLKLVFLDVYKYKNLLLSNKTSINELNIQIYPNPITTTFTIESSVPILSYRIYDTWGRLIKEVNVMRDTDLQCDLISENSGIYFIVAKTNQGILTGKIMKL